MTIPSVDRETTPSVLCFEQGRGGDGGDGVLTEKIPPPFRISSKGGGGEGMCQPGTPLSRNLSEEGVGDGVLKRKHHLHLMF